MLVAGFNTNEESVTDTAIPGKFLVVTSTDDGETWSEGIVIATGASWPGLYTLGDDRFLDTYSYDSPVGELVAATRVFELRRNVALRSSSSRVASGNWIAVFFGLAMLHSLVHL